MKSLLLIIAIIFCSIKVEAFPPTPPHCSNLSFEDCLGIFRKQASDKGISKETLEAVFPKINFVKKSVELDKKQPIKVLTLYQYFEKALSDNRVTTGQKLYKENIELLTEISEKYGVQPRFIIALWGLETNYGGYTGNFSIVDVLATLAYEGRRREFFTAELINALKIIDSGDTTYEIMKGSWAGAMGHCQFMPSSFLGYAQDYNGDGKKDIWGTKEDIFASIANYLSKRKWDDTATWGRRVELPKGFDKKLVGTDTEKLISEWQKLGVRKPGGLSLPKRKLMASIVIPDSKNPSASYMIYGNYKILLKWNRSTYFATAIGILATRIKYK